MAAPVLVIVGAQGTYGQAPPKPTIPGGTDVLVVVKIAWFFMEGAPTLTGGVGTFTLALMDGTAPPPTFDVSSEAIFYKHVAAADITTENAASYTFTPPVGGGDFLCLVEIYSGHDPVTPVPAGGVTSDAIQSTTGTPLTIPAPTISRADSITTIGCGAWDFGVWTNVPTGYSRTVTYDGTLEAAEYYNGTGQSVGSSAVFSAATQRVVGIQMVIQPPAATPQNDNALFFGAGTTS